MGYGCTTLEDTTYLKQERKTFIIPNGLVTFRKANQREIVRGALSNHSI